MPIFQLKVRLTAGALARGAALALLAATPAGCGDSTAKATLAGQQAQALLDAGDLPGARIAIGKALALRGDQVDLLLLDGRIKYRLNDYGAAYNSYNMALAIDPMNPEALQGVSQIGSSIGSETESVAAAEKILTMEPNNIPAMLVKGMQMLNRKDYAGAKRLADKMIATEPQGDAGLVLKARAMTLGGEQAEAMKLLNDGVKRAGPNRMLATALLETARDRGDADLMIQQFRTLADLVPRNVDLALDEINVQYKRGNMPGARARAQALLADSGTNDKAMARLAALWTEYDRTPLNPNQVATLAQDGAPTARLTAARFYLGAGDTAAAKTLIGTLRGFEPAGLRVRIGYAAGEEGSAGAAEQVLAGDRTNCDALTVRAAEALRNGKPKDAIVAAQIATAECPDRDGYDVLARAYAAKQEDAGVRRAYLDGINARPLSTPAAASFVAWLLSKRDTGNAVHIARSLTQRAPAQVSAWRLLRETCARAQDLVCVEQASNGEAAARRTFVIDLPPGERRANPLLGNRWQ